MSRIIEINHCKVCPYHQYNDGGGHMEGWRYCDHPQTQRKEIEVSDFYGFPKWCPLKEIGDYVAFAG